MPTDFQMDVNNPVAYNYPQFDFQKMISITNQTGNGQIPGISQLKSLFQGRDDFIDELDSCFNNNYEDTARHVFSNMVSPYKWLKMLLLHLLPH